MPDPGYESPHSDRTRFAINCPNTDGGPEYECNIVGLGAGTGGRMAGTDPETCSSSKSEFIGVVQQQPSDEFESLRGVASNSSEQLKNKHCTSSLTHPSIANGGPLLLSFLLMIGFGSTDFSPLPLDDTVLAVKCNIRFWTKRIDFGLKSTCFLDTANNITRRWPMRFRASLMSERLLETPRKTTERDSCGKSLAALRRWYPFDWLLGSCCCCMLMDLGILRNNLWWDLTGKK